MYHISLKIKQVAYPLHLLLLDLSQVTLSVHANLVLLDFAIEALLLPDHISDFPL